MKDYHAKLSSSLLSCTWQARIKTGWLKKKSNQQILFLHASSPTGYLVNHPTLANSSDKKLDVLDIPFTLIVYFSVDAWRTKLKL